MSPSCQSWQNFKQVTLYTYRSFDTVEFIPEDHPQNKARDVDFGHGVANMEYQVTWCFTPNQPVWLYKGETQNTKGRFCEKRS